MRAIKFNGRGRIEELLSILLGGTLAVIILLIICGSGILASEEDFIVNGIRILVDESYVGEHYGVHLDTYGVLREASNMQERAFAALKLVLE